MTELVLQVVGMDGRDSVREVSARLRDVPGVGTVSADHRRSVVRLGGSMRREAVVAALAGSRFRIRWISDPDSSGTGSGKHGS